LAAVLIFLGGCSGEAGQSIENGEFSQVTFDDGFGAECIDEDCTELVNTASSRPRG
jgi:hypothetical protein